MKLDCKQGYTLDEVKLFLSHQEALKKAYDYVVNFAAKPHPERGKPGAVCPFLPKAIKLDTIWMAVVDKQTPNREEIIGDLEHYIEWFKHINPLTGEERRYKSLILIFPGIGENEAPTLIDSIHQMYKRHLVYHELMIGDFHALSTTPGLYNPTFYPLRSSVPMIAIRYLIEEDLPFLTQPFDPPEVRIQFLEGYLHSLGDTLSTHSRTTAESALAQARGERTKSSMK
ncbi:DUF6875 domain-containing protein [Desmospora profundinema]|uniref:DUF6875 domain-containing protein n=1 Tax=Desmospora profundinema TaxID=1571184 RepID=A0ABU1IPM5_9BACL|nr:hypothetical protein [Desmospora profundinema]MDR6226723.1 hypothetical protein [Desmospora profundinema]